MKVQSTNFTEIPLLLWEGEVEHKYNYEKDANLNHKLRSVHPGCLLQSVKMTRLRPDVGP